MNLVQDLQKVIENSMRHSKMYSVPAGNEEGDIFIPIYEWVSYFTTEKLKVLLISTNVIQEW